MDIQPLRGRILNLKRCRWNPPFVTDATFCPQSELEQKATKITKETNCTRVNCFANYFAASGLGNLVCISVRNCFASSSRGASFNVWSRCSVASRG